MAQKPSVAMQCALLSHRGGGLPAAILPVANRLSHCTALISADTPDVVPAAAHYRTKRSGILANSYSILTALEPTIVHTHGLWSGLSMSALSFKKQAGAKLIVSPHGMLDSWALEQGRLKKQAALFSFERKHMNSSVFVHALNEQEARSIRAAGVTSPIAVVPNGVDLPSGPRPPKPDWMDRPTLLFLGRLHHKKGVPELIEAFAKCREALPEWQLAIAGWDDGPNNYRELASRTESRIVFPGPLFGNAKAAALANADAFVLPSRSEGLPMTILEAWAYQLPVFMTNECNLPEGFSNNAAIRIGFDPNSIAAAFREHLKDLDRLRPLTSAGHKLAVSKFSWERIAASFAELYDFVIGREDRPSCIWNDGAGCFG